MNHSTELENIALHEQVKQLQTQIAALELKIALRDTQLEISRARRDFAEDLAALKTTCEVLPRS